MLPSQRNLDDARFQRLARVKQITPRAPQTLGPAMVGFFKQSVQRRQTKLTKIAECWETLVPQLLNDHCALESLHRGTLTVIVDSASHLYEIKQLLLAGLQQQLLLACGGGAGLKKIALKPGRWYTGDGDRRPRFDD